MVALVGGGPVLMRATAGSDVKKVARVSTEDAYQNLGKATELLESGKESEARQLLDATSGQPLVVVSGAHGEGELKEFSPTTLLMRLGRAIGAHAGAAADRGDKETALAWVGRCEDLSRQILDSPAPTLDALNMARFLDNMADRTEAAVYAAAKDTVHAEQVAHRRSDMDRFWHENILKELGNLSHRWADGEATAGKAEQELVREKNQEEEIKVAEGMVRRYQLQRMQGRTAHQTRVPSSRPIDA